MTFQKADKQQDVPEEERELSRLLELFQAHLPVPRNPTSTDKATILRYLANAPQLTTFRKNGLERFLAKVGVLPDGRVICTLPFPFVQSDFDFRPLVWGSKFGSCLRLLLATEKIPAQATFVPGEKSFDALQSGRIVFVSYRLERVQTIQEFDLASSPEAQSTFKDLIVLCARHHAEIAAADSYIFSTDLVRANSVSVKYFSKHWTRLEWLQRGWINECDCRSHDAILLISDAKDEITNAFKLPLVRKFTLLYEVLCTLNSSHLSKNAQVSEVISKCKRFPLNQLCVELHAFDRELLLSSIHTGDAATIKSTFGVAFAIWNLLELDPELSDWGRLQISFDPQGKEIIPVTIDPYGFPIEKDEDAGCFWGEKLFRTMLSNRDRLLSPSDLLLDLRSYVDGFSAWQFDLDENEAKETITQLLNEAVALREWTIPPNAFCELHIGPFIGAEVIEIGDDVYFIWRSANNRFWDMSVGVVRQDFVNTGVFRVDTQQGDRKAELQDDRKAELSIQLLMSAIIRDFWVVTERQKIFGVKRRRTARAGVDDDPRRGHLFATSTVFRLENRSTKSEFGSFL
jgi:hypothetical protein